MTDFPQVQARELTDEEKEARREQCFQALNDWYVERTRFGLGAARCGPGEGAVRVR